MEAIKEVVPAETPKLEEVQCGRGHEVIVALDAEALYPSISPEVAIQVCKEAALSTNIEVQHMNLLEATRRARGWAD